MGSGVVSPPYLYYSDRCMEESEQRDAWSFKLEALRLVNGDQLRSPLESMLTFLFEAADELEELKFLSTM